MNNTFIFHPIKKKKGTFYVIFILRSTEYRRLVMTHPVISQNLFKKLDLAHKWINCCNKSINVGVFTAGIVCIVYFNCFVVYLALLSMFLFRQVSWHVIMPNQIWNLNELLNAAICSNPSFVVPGDLEVVSFVLM